MENESIGGITKKEEQVKTIHASSKIAKVQENQQDSISC